MKKLLVVLAVAVISNISFTQHFHSFSPFRDSTGYPTRPIDTRNTYYLDNIDTNKVKQLLYEKFNEFRADYNVASCVKSTRLHNYAQSWAYGFLGSSRHMSSLTNPDFKEVGIGITFDVSGHPNQHRIYTVVQLKR